MEKQSPAKLQKLQQIRLATGSRNGFTTLKHDRATKADYAREHEDHQASLLSMCPAELWHHNSYRAICPRPILVRKHHHRQLEALSEALVIAITDIVKRWWIDKDARFFERMPLEPEEEELLQWLDDQVARGNLRGFHECHGSWRPDFLIEERGGVETFLITEINARFAFNGYIHLAHGQDALERMNQEDSDLVGGATSMQVFDGLRRLVKPGAPLHLLKGEEAGIDIHMLIGASERIFGITPRLISPSDLRLEPNSQGKDKYRLCCLANSDANMFPKPLTFINNQGEVLEEIEQVGLELHQHELFGLPREILQQVSLRCFNDMRSILLAHDKRMLGIVKQELQQLARTQVLTPVQALALHNGISDTFIPGSPELRSLFQASISSPDIKDGYLLKPIRGGKGAGILFGEDIDSDEWASILERLRFQETGSISEGKTYVVQRRVKQCLYDLILHASGEKLRYPLVGTWHVVNGRFGGLGTWRSSCDRICAVSSGGAIICSVSKQYERRG
ncbi:hypothetical protein GGR50DRAFT_260275 [Xylaria sp. CBS 124048]|nr:hypothetical protein GGR50DRAFT_260275 [Xylaria sp. CBS 124048]